MFGDKSRCSTCNQSVVSAKVAEKKSNKKFLSSVEERWYYKWRHVCAYVFLVICLFDFILMPAIYEYHDKANPITVVELALKFTDAQTQSMAMQILLNKRTWDPLTLKGAGIFFVAFGAILGIASFNRNSEKMERFRNLDDFHDIPVPKSKPKTSRVDSPD